MSKHSQALDSLIEMSALSEHGVGGQGAFIVQHLNQRAALGDQEAVNMLDALARTGAQHEVHEYNRRQTQIIQLPSGPFAMRSKIGIKTEVGFQVVMWQLCPVEELDGYIKRMNSQHTVIDKQLEVLRGGLALAEKYGTSTVREALIADGQDPNAIEISISA